MKRLLKETELQEASCARECLNIISKAKAQNMTHGQYALKHQHNRHLAVIAECYRYVCPTLCPVTHWLLTRGCCSGNTKSG